MTLSAEPLARASFRASRYVHLSWRLWLGRSLALPWDTNRQSSPILPRTHDEQPVIPGEVSLPVEDAIMERVTRITELVGPRDVSRMETVMNNEDPAAVLQNLSARIVAIRDSL